MLHLAHSDASSSGLTWTSGLVPARLASPIAPRLLHTDCMWRGARSYGVKNTCYLKSFLGPQDKNYRVVTGRMRS